MRQDIDDETLAAARLELWHRVCSHGDQQTWAAFQRSIEGTVLTWFYNHPGSEAACRTHSESHFIALAFEQLRQAVLQRQGACETFSEVLVYLHASLSGVIMETLRTSSRPRAICEHELAEQGPRGNPQCSEVWNWVQATLSGERERRLAYLLYHCGLEPEEIVRNCPQEWSDVHEVARLRHTVIERLLRNMNQLTLTAHGLGEEMGREEREKEEN
jgi:hypothetical protein